QHHMQQAVLGNIERAHLSNRCRFVGSSMFESLPAGADLYVIKHVIHDWPDSDAVQILARICAAMTASSRLIMIEGMVDQACNHSDRLHTSEPPRDSRRLHYLRGWSHEQIDEVF